MLSNCLRLVLEDAVSHAPNCNTAAGVGELPRLCSLTVSSSKRHFTAYSDLVQTSQLSIGSCMLHQRILHGWCSMLRMTLHVSWHTATYYAVFAFFYWFKGSLDSSWVEWLFGADRLPSVHLYTLAKQLQLWHAPHYRAPTFVHDLRSNLKNVAIPGTGKYEAGIAPCNKHLKPRWQGCLNSQDLLQCHSRVPMF